MFLTACIRKYVHNIHVLYYVPTFLRYIFSEDDDPLGMKHKEVFKIWNNFVVFIIFNILTQYQDRGREVSFNKITRTPDLIKQGVSL